MLVCRGREQFSWRTSRSPHLMNLSPVSICTLLPRATPRLPSAHYSSSEYGIHTWWLPSFPTSLRPLCPQSTCARSSLFRTGSKFNLIQFNSFLLPFCHHLLQALSSALSLSGIPVLGFHPGNSPPPLPLRLPLLHLPPRHPCLPRLDLVLPFLDRAVPARPWHIATAEILHVTEVYPSVLLFCI